MTDVRVAPGDRQTRQTLAALLVACAVTVAGACATPASQHRAGEAVWARAGDEVRNVILLIGDGVGAAYWTAARWEAGALEVERMPVAGLTDTRSASSYVTDSAAGATVYAAGRRTYNRAIGVGPRCRELFTVDSAAVMRDPASCDPLETVFDIAWAAGIGTGLVATSDITHATPAAFGAKVPDRRMQDEIAAQYAENPIDVLLGGGRDRFVGDRRLDGRDLLGPLCRLATCLETAEALEAYAPDERRLIGLFAREHMEAAERRSPTLPEMARAALARLSRNERGFLLVVEGSQPDFRGHDNRPFPRVAAEMLDFDRAIGVALDFAERTPGTLVLVVADHETGGLALRQQTGAPVARYATTGHTGEMTPHFAAGSGTEQFAGILDNEEIGRRLLEIVRARAEAVAP